MKPGIVSNRTNHGVFPSGIMTKPLAPSVRSPIVRYLLLGWQPEAIAEEVHCAVTTVRVYRQNLFMWNSTFRPQRCEKGRPNKITIAVKKALMVYLAERPYLVQQELAWYLWEELAITVSQPTISRLIMAERRSRKVAQRIGHRQNDELRQDWRAQCIDLRAEQLVFIDEASFNEATGWRHFAYAPVGEPARYHASRRRGHSWSILPAYTIDGYLPCTGVKEGWFNGEGFYSWVANELLPHCNAYPAPRSVIVMDNVSLHCNPRIAELIRSHGCEVRYLPPYSPDFNPIELTFSVLKDWIRRHFDEAWPVYEGTFGDFLRLAIERSNCDGFPRAHFRHSGLYILEEDLRAFERALEQGNRAFKA